MERATIELEVPNAVMDAARTIANAENSSVKAVLQGGLQSAFWLTSDTDFQLESMREFGDEQLWAVINRRLTWAQNSRLRQLMEQNSKGNMTQSESDELDDLIDIIDKFILLRSRALLLMKQRGHDIDSFLDSGG